MTCEDKAVFDDASFGGRVRARTPIQRFYPHPPHQRLHVTAADLAPLGSQQAFQQPRSREGELQPAHDQEVGFQHRTRQVVDAAAADIECLGLPSYRKVVGAVEHRFALAGRLC